MTARTITFAVPGTVPAYQVKLTADEARVLLEDVQGQLEALDTVDHERLEALIETAVWKNDHDEREYSVIATLSDALDWACSSCRDEVGWAERSWLDRQDGVVTITVICGHCGGEDNYDATGNELDSVYS